MRAGRVFVSTVLAVCASVAAGAQQSQNTVLEAHRVTPKAGMRAQLEAGRVKHMAWHKQQGDTWAWHVWEVTTGPETGSYIVTSPNHQWQDFDAWAAKMGKGDAADGAVNLAPYQASSSTSYWVMLADASRPPAPGGPLVMGTFTTYRIKQGKGGQFREALRTIKGALEKGNYPRRSIWYTLANGGPTGTFAAFVPRASMAEMALTEPSMRDVVETAIGRSAGEAALDAFNDAVESGSSELLEFRADLSYLPPSQ
jgi:hypothetical protein